MFVDTHAHLTEKAFSTDFEKVVCDAKKCGVEKIITSGYDLHSSKDAMTFAQKYDNVFASIGVYPEYSESYTQEVENSLKNLALNKKVVAIGEIGLQYTEGMPDKNLQKEVFVKQLKLASFLNLPIIIHCRDAYGDMIEILKENKKYLDNCGTFHCFAGSKEIAKEAIKLGFYISVGGVSTFKNAIKLQDAIKDIPLERIILETDCPYLSPQPYRGQRNEPARVTIIAQNLAKLKGVSDMEVERITSENARRLFKI